MKNIYLKNAIRSSEKNGYEGLVGGKIYKSITGSSLLVEIEPNWLFPDEDNCPKEASMANLFLRTRINIFAVKLEDLFHEKGWPGINKLLGKYERIEHDLYSEVLCLEKCTEKLREFINKMITSS